MSLHRLLWACHAPLSQPPEKSAKKRELTILDDPCAILAERFYSTRKEVHARHDPDECEFDTLDFVVFMCRREHGHFHKCDETCAWLGPSDDNEHQRVCALTGMVHQCDEVMAEGVLSDALLQNHGSAGSAVRKKGSTQAVNEKVLKFICKVLHLLLDIGDRVFRKIRVYKPEHDAFGNLQLDRDATSRAIPASFFGKTLTLDTYHEYRTIFQDNVSKFAECLNTTYRLVRKLSDGVEETGLVERKMALWIFSCVLNFFQHGNGTCDIFPRLAVLGILPCRDQTVIDGVVEDPELHDKLKTIRCCTTTKEGTKWQAFLRRLPQHKQDELRTTIRSCLPREFL
jgi:hypothetical protein